VGLGARRSQEVRESPGLAARQAAAALLSEILDNHRPLDACLEAADSPLAGLSLQDRSLARAIVATALRRHGQIETALGALIERKLPKRAGALPSILQVAATQLLFMDVPDHAAVSLAVQSAEADSKARHFKSLANGVLRNLVRRRDELLGGQDAARFNTPEWLWQRWAAAHGTEAHAIAAAHLDEPPLDVSVNGEAAAWAERLGGAALPTGTVRFSAKGRIEALPGYGEGAWWVQDFAAAMPARLLGDVASKEVLDLCAAPGGKTAQLAAAGAKVTAVDIAVSRVARLKENLSRLRLDADCIIADALAFDPGRAFDAVLLDAPCSATGTIRRHPDIPWLKSVEDIASLATTQRALIARAASLVRPGGALVFATCSLEPEEGEDQAKAALADLPLEAWPIVPDEFPGLSPDWVSGGWLRTLPRYSPAPGISGGMDGFFAARFRRL
jgi:16S rRNA (cytosine967-C5)-methyltransferase